VVRFLLGFLPEAPFLPLSITLIDLTSQPISRLDRWGLWFPKPISIEYKIDVMNFSDLSLLKAIEDNQIALEDVLDLSGFAIEALPYQAFELHHLKHLIIGAAHGLNIAVDNFYISDSFSALVNLETIEAKYVLSVSNIQAIRLLPKLKSLLLTWADERAICFDSKGRKPLSLDGLTSGTLEELDVHYSYGVDLRNMHLPNLKIFDGTGIGCQSLSFLKTCPLLEDLYLSDNPELESLSDLSYVPCLKTLDISGCHGIKDLSPLKTCPLLEDLRLSGNPELESLSDLSYVPCLKTLDIRWCHGIKDLSPLKKLKYLSKVILP
jgi:Leucine-rich repeat (LRR) protein